MTEAQLRAIKSLHTCLGRALKREPMHNIAAEIFQLNSLDPR